MDNFTNEELAAMKSIVFSSSSKDEEDIPPQKKGDVFGCVLITRSEKNLALI